MQLRILLLLLVIYSFVDAQNPVNPDSTAGYSHPRQFREPIEADFLFNYYSQEGDHSAVTGGIGTEELTDEAATIIVTVPLDSVSRLSAEGAMNHYTSASSDNIDFDVSSASRDDYRGQLYIGYNRILPHHRQEIGFRFGGSIETDVISTSLVGNWRIENAAKSRWFSVSAQYFYDNWLPIFPEELRFSGRQLIENDSRKTYSLSLNFGQVINRQLQVALFSDLVFQQGLLSTPFHRVYFSDQSSARVERLPARRFKWPLAIRANWYATEQIILRFYYRLYMDSFQINANTLSLEMPVKLGNTLTVYPFYRFHHQTAAEHFGEYRQLSNTAEFYTSDFDLSRFGSHKQGLGVRWDPLDGLTRFKFPSPNTITVLQSLDLRYSDYQRGDGLSFYAISLGLGFLFL